MSKKFTAREKATLLRPLFKELFYYDGISKGSMLGKIEKKKAQKNKELILKILS